MALWKKILIWMASICGLFLVVALIFYIIVSNIRIPSLPEGNYSLTKVTSVIGDEQTILEEYNSSEYYITVKPDNKIESHSLDKGVFENEAGYDYLLYGKEIYLFASNEEDIAYAGHFNSTTVKIEVRTEEGYICYYYSKTENQ